MPATPNSITSQPTITDGLWIHIVPKGELWNEAAQVMQVLDDPALNTILAGIEADKQRLGVRWPGIYAGREHHIYDEEQDSEALAWFKEFEKRSDGIWANGNGLTDIGRDAVQSGRYKFTSFVADPKNLESLGGKRFRVLKIDTVGFTNQANGKDLLTPITNRRQNMVLNTDTLSAVQAAAEFSKLVNRAVAQKGLSFDQAWNQCRAEHPRLFNRMAAVEVAAPHRNAPNSQPVNEKSARSASDRFSALVTNRAQRQGVPFSQAWSATMLEFPDLYTKAAGMVFNRDQVGSTADFKRAEKLGDDVLERLMADVENPAHEDRGNIISNDAALLGAFKRELQRLIAEGMTPERAFEEIKSTEPVFWQRFVLNY